MAKTDVAWRSPVTDYEHGFPGWASAFPVITKSTALKAPRTSVIEHINTDTRATGVHEPKT